MKKLNLPKIVLISFAFFVATAIVSSAQTFTTLLNFNGGNGSSPGDSIIQGTDGNFYGVTTYGGSKTCSKGCGTVFGITPKGQISTVKFNGSSGVAPVGGVLQSTNGNFYGTTYSGGTTENGIVFEVASGGTLSTLHNFDLKDGSSPNSPLIEGFDGGLYGTTFGQSGSNGTVFKITPAGALTTLYAFCADKYPRCSDGARPEGGLLLAPNGNFYGVTTNGGTGPFCTAAVDGCGTVFELTPTGTLTTLYNFCSQTACADGSYPIGGLVQGPNGNLYGTTEWGGTNPCIIVSIDYGCGIVFELTPQGQFTNLHNFCSEINCADGSYPENTMVLGTDGDLYGTATNGALTYCVDGGSGCGTIFRITKGGTFAILHTFSGGDGGSPDGLVQSTNGSFYGTTTEGGVNFCGVLGLNFGCGTFFSLDVDLGPFVHPLLNFGSVGSTVEILGTNLTGATGVTFNGSSASFTVASSSYIEASVPTGATTGTVEVTTPSGTLSSNVPFQVLP